ncbi:MAG TPA: YtxH domain-containing protein [Candidatus Aquicultor sp.]
MASPLSLISDAMSSERVKSAGEDIANRASQLYREAQNRNYTLYALIAVSGFAAGLLTGLLIAPSSGYETRSRISNQALSTMSGARKMMRRDAEEMREQAEEIAS